MSRKHQFGNLARLCRRPQIGIAIALAILLIGSSVAYANNCVWINPGSDNWGNSNDWLSGTMPVSSSDGAYIDYGGTATVNATATAGNVFVGTNFNSSYAGNGTLYVTSGGALSCGTLRFGYSGNYAGNLTQDGGTLTSSASEFFGAANSSSGGGTGVCNQSGGLNGVTSSLYIGYGTSLTGCAYYLSGSGTVSGSGLSIYVGDNSAGILSQTGALSSINVGSTGYEFIGSVLGYNGTFTQSAGTNTVGGLYFGPRVGGTGQGGTYSLNGGYLVAGGIYNSHATVTNFNLGGGTLQWSNASAGTCSVPMTLTAATTSTIDVQNHVMTLSGALSSSGSLTVGTGTTTGTLTLSSASNSYTGSTTLGGGVLNVGNQYALQYSQLNYSTGTVTFASGVTAATFGGLSGSSNLSLINLGSSAVTLTVGGAASTTYSGALSGTSGALTMAGSGTLVLSGSNSYSGVTTISNGTLQLGDGTTNGTIAGASIVDNAALAFTYGPSTSPTYSGVISGSGTVTKSGTGTLTLSNANTYGGNTTVNNGTLAFGADNVIPSGSSAGNVAVNTGATLDLAGHNATINGLNDGAGGGGTVDSTVAGTPTLTVGGNNATSAFSGTIQNTAGTLSLTKIGTGTVTLSGSLSYTGRTTIQGGTLEAIGAGGLALLSSAGLDIQHGEAVLDYTGLIDPMTLDPIANTLMQQARANGWVIDATHPIGSTTAATDPLVHALGWTDTVVGGRTLLTVMYTLCGDADLNGTVTGADLNVVLSNYNKTGMYWSQGDFNYDGTVNGADLNMVLSNYNQSVSVGAAVPEPSTLLLAAAGLAGLLAYAWRKRK